MPTNTATKKFSLEGALIKPLKVQPVFPGAKPVTQCTLLTITAVHNCLHPAISHRYNKTVTDTTDLRAASGLGLDDTAIRTDLYGVVVLAVHEAGCRLRFFSPSNIVICKKVGDICKAVWADLSHP
jgi:hypothetical protein